jgi:hypothetical protein
MKWVGQIAVESVWGRSEAMKPKSSRVGLLPPLRSDVSKRFRVKVEPVQQPAKFQPVTIVVRDLSQCL